MAQHDYVIANASGLAVRQDINNALAAVVSNNSGSAAPSTTYAYMWWPDTTTGLLKQRNAANSAWITVGTLGSANLGLLPTSGGTLTGALLADDGGTAALPAVAFDGDANTGIYRKAANEVGVATAGILRAWFDSAGVNLDAQGDTRYWDSDSSNYVAFQAPATVASNVTWTLPSTDGTNGQALTTNGSGVLSFAAAGAQMTRSTAVNTTSGTAIDFTGIPSWVKRITVMFNGVSTNGASSYLIQLGTGVTPTYATSGYLGSALRAAASVTSETVNSSGFRVVDSIAAASINHGSVFITNLTSNTWIEQGVVCLSNVASANISGGSVALSGALTAVRITTVNGTDTFDAGSVNILYEG